MKKLWAALLTLSLALSAGCGGENAPVVNTDGSTSMERVMGALMEGFREREPGITVNYSGTGSGAGIQAVLSGACDIGLSSRPLTEAERAGGAVAHTVALDGVAVVVNPENTVTDLSAEDLAGIFTGRITRWSRLGGPDAPIAVYGREAGSGTRTAFEEILRIRDACRYTGEYSSNGDIVGSVASNPNGIGYVSLSAVGDRVRALRVDGAVCSADTIRDGSYAIQRPFLLVTGEAGALSEAARTFLDYALSGAVADYIAAAGAIAP